MAYTVKIQQILPLTHDVKQIKTEKPKDYSFISGQATDVAINKKKWEDEKRPFSFTSLPEDDQLEFVIKSYRDHDGVTNQIDKLDVGDELVLDDPWGAIEYKGKGIFIAGGAGVTPFIGIIKSLQAKGKLTGNRLFFANKTSKDVILESYFRDLLRGDFISILAKEDVSGHEFGMIDKEFLKKHIQDFTQKFYVCGPDPMVKAISATLKELGANPDEIVFEK